jgi:iron complex outermembrane receptor protein
MINITKRNSLGLAISMATFVGASAFAAGTSSLMEEVIVTADKRSESVQDVSASITALNSEMMARAGIDDVTRLEHVVPGMRMGQSGNEARIAIRGTRSNNVGTEGEQTVGIFQDGIYVATSTQALGSYVDLERIEVLRGPQGTLYGRNTFGGAINVISKAPDFEATSGSVTALVGYKNRRKMEGVLNLPLSETLAIRLVGMTDEHDGYITNSFSPGTDDDLDNQDTTYIRMTAVWQPTEDFEATLRYSESSKDTNSTAIWGYQQIGGYLDGIYQDGHVYQFAGATQDAGPWDVSRNESSAAILDDESLTLELSYDMNFATAKLTVNQVDFEGVQFYDSDYSDAGSLSAQAGKFVGWNSSQEDSSTELQLTSNGDGALQWALGYYQFKQESDWGWIGSDYSGNGTYVEYIWGHNMYESESTAIYGNASYSVTDNVRLIAGIRSNEDTKGRVGSLNTWDDTLWKAAVEVDLSEDIMVYASASTGFRAGGSNGAAVVALLAEEGIDADLYDPEAVTAFEAGVKTALQDGRLTLNAAVFMNEYRDMQAQSFVLINMGATEYTMNGGEIDATGLEVEMQWAPTDNWYITANVAFLDAEFGTYDVAALAGLGALGGRQVDLDGNGTLDSLSLKGYAPALSPELTAGFQISYDIDLGDMGTLTPMLQGTYTSDYYAFDINVAPTEQKAHTKSDVRLIWNSGDNVKVEAYILNIEDEAVMNRAVVFGPGVTGTVAAGSSVASVQSSWSRPRTWGMSISYDF